MDGTEATGHPVPRTAEQPGGPGPCPCFTN